MAIIDSLQKLYTIGIQNGNVLLLLSDAAAYMKKAYDNVLQQLFPKMVHVTCIVHILYNIVEYVRGCFPEVDKLIFAVKKLFKKSPKRMQIFREMFLNTFVPGEIFLGTVWNFFWKDHKEMEYT